MVSNLHFKKIIHVFLIASTLLFSFQSHAEIQPVPEKDHRSITLIVASTVALCSMVAYGLHKLYTWHKNYVRRNELQKAMPIREYESALDADTLKGLLTHSYKEEELTSQEAHAAIKQVQETIADKGNVTYVSYDIIDGTNTLCAFLIAGKKGWIEFLAVDPAHYRKGYGERLLRHAIKELRDTFNCKEISLGALDYKAQYLYEKVGFIKTKEFYRKVMPIYRLTQPALAGI